MENRSESSKEKKIGENDIAELIDERLKSNFASQKGASGYTPKALDKQENQTNSIDRVCFEKQCFRTKYEIF